MEKLTFSVRINAPKQIVWNTMLDDTTYRQWTEPFHVGSYYEGNWSEGSKMLFLGPEADGTLSGMVSRIMVNRPYEYLSIQHLGEIHNGVEDTTSVQVQQWAGAHENYTLTEDDGVTTVNIELDANADLAEMFHDMWPKALQKLKQLAER